MIIVVFAWIVATIIVYLNAQLVFEKISGWSNAAGDYRWLVLATAVPFSLGLAALLLYMTFRKEPGKVVESKSLEAIADRVATIAGTTDTQPVRRIGVALEAEESDATMLAEAVAMAKNHNAQLVLIHVVEGVGGQYHGAQAGDVESEQDKNYLELLVARLQHESGESKSPGISFTLGYGDVQREIARIATEEKLDLLILGSHGHRGLSDIIRGTTIDGVRHKVKIPVMAVRKRE
jgi:manganese transport protein